MERATDLNAGAPFWHAGACHCGRVRIEAFAPANLDILECNCSMCDRSSYLHLIVSAEKLRLIAGADDLVEYRFGSGIARHLFCRHCGVKTFYVPRSHPDSYSVNARCLDPSRIASIRIQPFDGRHWESARSELDTR